jgi:cytochrome oxidase Cu insertion factor (SCO1/SenC/PrrC family)
MKNLSRLLKSSQRHKSKLCKAILPAIVLSVSLFAEMRSPAAASLVPTVPQQTQAARKPKTSYTCPMHPEVKSARRGKCPKCGMALRLAPADPVVDASATALKELKVEAKPTDASAEASSTKKMVIPDIVVLDQDGKAVHFYTDLIKGKTVAINFIFTTCTTICPPLAATFARVQKEMGDKVGRDVHFISISVDPLTDTPERLKAWGAKFKAGAGWTFVTGDKQEMEKLLSALGASVSRREDHSPTVIVGNDAKGIWTRTYGLAKSSQMVGLILNVMEGKAEGALAAEPKQ